MDDETFLNLTIGAAQALQANALVAEAEDRRAALLPPALPPSPAMDSTLGFLLSPLPDATPRLSSSDPLNKDTLGGVGL